MFEHLVRVGQQNRLRRLRALLGRIDKRSLSMTAENLRARPDSRFAFRHQITNNGKRRFNLIPCYRHGRGQKGRNAVFHNARCHIAQALGAAVGRILAQISMDMHIHKARRHIQSLRVDHLVRTAVTIRNIYDLFIKEQRLVFHDAVFENDFSVDNRLHITCTWKDSPRSRPRPFRAEKKAARRPPDASRQSLHHTG